MNGHPAPCRRQVWQRSLPLILIAILAIAFLTVTLLSAVALSGCGSGETASTRAWVTVIDDDHFKLRSVPLPGHARQARFQGRPIVIGGNDQAELGRTA